MTAVSVASVPGEEIRQVAHSHSHATHTHTNCIQGEGGEGETEDADHHRRRRRAFLASRSSSPASIETGYLAAFVSV